MDHNCVVVIIFEAVHISEVYAWCWVLSYLLKRSNSRSAAFL